MPYLKINILFIALLPFLAVADTDINRDIEKITTSGTVNFYLENDLFDETDQNYTNGIRISWESQDLSSFEDDPRLPTWIREANDRLSFFHDLKGGLQRNLVMSFGQLMYTPENIHAKQVIENDRPYAGYLYMGFAYHTRSNNQLDTLEINLGIVGPASQADHTQDLVHDLRGFDKFEGWHNQLKNEPTIQFLYEHKHRYTLPAITTDGIQQDFITHNGISLGNLASYLNTGAEYRIGWQLPEDFGTSAVRPGSDNSAPGVHDIRRKGIGIYGLHAFVTVDARLMANDIFLDGNTFTNSHSVDKEYAVADIATGISFLMAGWKISYAKVWRTKEFREQNHHHSYGSISASYTW